MWRKVKESIGGMFNTVEQERSERLIGRLPDSWAKTSHLVYSSIRYGTTVKEGGKRLLQDCFLLIKEYCIDFTMYNS